MSDISKALYLMVGGMAIVFAALAVLFLAMLILERVFRTSDEEAEEVVETVAEETSEAADRNREKAVAIASALAILTEERASRRPASEPIEGHPGSQPSSWRAFGRQDQMRSRFQQRNKP